MIDGILFKILELLEISNKKSICLILATRGYPDDYPKDTIIDNLNNFENTEDFYIFHAATKLENNKVLSTGGRVLSIVSLNDSYSECREKVYEIANKIEILAKLNHFGEID